MVAKLQSSKEKRIVKVNDLFAQDLVQTTRAHMMYLSFFMFKFVVDSTEFKNKNSKELLYLLAKVYALKQLTLDCTACYETGFFSAGSKGLLMEAMKKALIELRPHMIPLVELDSDELIDKSNTSAIGNKWGDIYEAMLERAMQSRLNAKPKPEYWDSLIKPIIKADYSAHL